jgi:hypothetical protein
MGLAEVRIGHQQKAQLGVEGRALRPQFQLPPIRADVNRHAPQGHPGAGQGGRPH